MRYAIVMGYGLFDPKTARNSYKGYLRDVATFANGGNADAIVLCGGSTNIKKSGESEAASMADYIEPMLKRPVRIILSDRSTTTLQNIEFAKRLTKFKKTDKVTVFCHDVRLPTIIWFILHYWFGLRQKQITNAILDYYAAYYKKRYTTEGIGREMTKEFRYKNVAVRSHTLDTTLNEAIGINTLAIVEILAFYNPELRRRITNIIKLRRRLANIEEYKRRR
ncbi:MAG: YdcF family protein [Candidatus Marsarchaeota archaeon]|nr:YdcF family protein [Candidatus Marsarchaeota archaeon]MCL5115213.1 YdcF family protein [Candidatus Marsarchaeota archaeon]